MDEEYISKSKDVQVLPPVDLTIPISNVNQVIPHFTRDEINYLLSKINPGRDLVIYQFLWRTGVRVTEMVSLLKKDLNFRDGTITIRWLKNRKYEYRVVPMHHTLKPTLSLFTSKIYAEDRVFPISRQRVFQMCKRDGFGHPHKFRHSFAINFLKQTNNPMGMLILRDLLGHSNIQTTMIYLKVVPMQMQQAIDEVSFD